MLFRSNPRRVRIFAAEKGITLPSRELSIPAREHKSDEFLALNPRGQTPALQLDDGTVIATTSPGRTPWATSAAATPAEARSSCA